MLEDDLWFYNDEALDNGDYAPVCDNSKVYLIDRNMNRVSDMVNGESVISYGDKLFTYRFNDKCYIMSYKVNSVKPTDMRGVKVKSTAKSSVNLSWTKNTSASGYQIQQYKNGKWVTLKTINKNTTLTSSITKLASKSTYKFRVRAFKTIEGVKYFGSFTEISAKTK